MFQALLLISQKWSNKLSQDIFKPCQMVRLELLQFSKKKIIKKKKQLNWVNGFYSNLTLLYWSGIVWGTYPYSEYYLQLACSQPQIEAKQGSDVGVRLSHPLKKNQYHIKLGLYLKHFQCSVLLSDNRLWMRVITLQSHGNRRFTSQNRPAAASSVSLFVLFITGLLHEQANMLITESHSGASAIRGSARQHYSFCRLSLLTLKKAFVLSFLINQQTLSRLLD